MRRIAVLGTLFLGAVAVVGSAMAAIGSSPGDTDVASTVVPHIVAAQESPEAALAQDQRVGGPRDPFKPLIDESDPLASTTSTTTAGGTTSTTSGTGSTTSTSTTVAGGTTSTTGFVPGTVTVALKEIRTVGGELQATIEVDGVTYIVGEGDTFAGDFTVVTLFSNRAVLTFQGRTFELRVGEAILK
jgi:hypothetical protein